LLKLNPKLKRYLKSENKPRKIEFECVVVAYFQSFNKSSIIIQQKFALTNTWIESVVVFKIQVQTYEKSPKMKKSGKTTTTNTTTMKKSEECGSRKKQQSSLKKLKKKKKLERYLREKELGRKMWLLFEKNVYML